jgi:O-antigen/teichoic acid export membrane protein
MTAAAVSKGVRFQTLKRRALSLGAVKAFDHGLQFLLPLVLVRCLDAATFGEYRLLWLAVGTLMAFATLNMAGTLYFFVPPSEPRRKRLYVHQTMLFLAGAGLVCGVALSAWNPWLPRVLEPLERHGALVPAFIALWVGAILLDYLPTIDERIRLQAWATLSVALLRALLVGFGAWASGSMDVILWLLLATVAVKLAFLIAYVKRQHGLGRPWFERAAFSEQVRHSAPIGLSNAAYSLRGQGDQWVAASLFALTSFAAFSIAALVAQVVYVFRHSVLEAILPSMSRLQAAGDMRGMLEMNSRANVIVGMLLFPLLAFAFVFAGEIVTVLYTASYVEAVPAMRVYIVGMLAMVVEIGSLVLLLRQGPYALKVSALMLAFSVGVSFTAAQQLGLAGAAAGSVIAIYLDRVLMLMRISRLAGVTLRRLQDWPSLFWALVSAAVSGAAAWAFVEHLVVASGALARAAIGGSVLITLYAILNLRKLR